MAGTHPANAPILDVRGLTVRFGSRTVLRDVNFTVAPGDTLAVIGPNGAGKTVLFRALIGGLPADGDVRWAPGVRIGYVPQRVDLERDIPITGWDFLGARAALTGASRDQMRAGLADVGLSIDASRQPIGALSGGQFQRLLIAFALVGHPNVLLLDEPTSGIDEPGQERLQELVSRLQREQGLTVLLISHELTLVSRHATIVLCLGRTGTHFGPPGTTLTSSLLEEMYRSPMAVHHHDH